MENHCDSGDLVFGELAEYGWPAEAIFGQLDEMTADDRDLIDRLAAEVKKGWERAEELVFERDEAKSALESLLQRVSGEKLEESVIQADRIEREEYQRVLNEKNQLIQKMLGLEAQLEKSKAERHDNLEMYNQHLNNVNSF